MILLLAAKDDYMIFILHYVKVSATVSQYQSIPNIFVVFHFHIYVDLH